MGELYVLAGLVWGLCSVVDHDSMGLLIGVILLVGGSIIRRMKK